MNVVTEVITGWLAAQAAQAAQVGAQRPDAHAAPAPAVAAAVARPEAPGPHRGQAGVMRGHGLRPVEHGEGGHDHLGVLEAVAQPLQDGGEGGPLLGDGMPALTHQPVQGTRAVVRGLQSENQDMNISRWIYLIISHSPSTICHELHDFLVGSAWIRHVAQGHDLPQQDSK